MAAKGMSIVSGGEAASEVKRKMPRRIEKIFLPKPYQDFYVVGWINFGKKFYDRTNAIGDGDPNPYDADIAPDAPDIDEEEKERRTVEKNRRLEIAEASRKAMAEAMSQIIIETNLVDDDGEDFPPTNDPLFYEMAQGEYLPIIMRAIRSRIGRLDPPKGGS